MNKPPDEAKRNTADTAKAVAQPGTVWTEPGQGATCNVSRFVNIHACRNRGFNVRTTGIARAVLCKKHDTRYGDAIGERVLVVGTLRPVETIIHERPPCPVSSLCSKPKDHHGPCIGDVRRIAGAK